MLLQDSTRQKHCLLDRTNWSLFGYSSRIGHSLLSGCLICALLSAFFTFSFHILITWSSILPFCTWHDWHSFGKDTAKWKKNNNNSCLDYLRRFLSSVKHKGRCCTQNVIAANLILVLLGRFGTTQCIAKCLHSTGQPKTFKQICLVDYVSTCNMN